MSDGIVIISFCLRRQYVKDIFAKRTLRAEEIVRHFAPRRTRLYILIRFAFRRVIDPLAHAALHHADPHRRR